MWLDLRLFQRLLWAIVTSGFWSHTVWQKFTEVSACHLFHPEYTWIAFVLVSPAQSKFYGPCKVQSGCQKSRGFLSYKNTFLTAYTHISTSHSVTSIIQTLTERIEVGARDVWTIDYRVRTGTTKDGERICKENSVSELSVWAQVALLLLLLFCFCFYLYVIVFIWVRLFMNSYAFLLREESQILSSIRPFRYLKVVTCPPRTS
jgi:hypothetical protein